MAWCRRLGRGQNRSECPPCASLEIIQGAGHALATLLEHMRVNHRGGHIGMAQKFLDGADVRAPLQEVRREAVPLMPSSA